MHRDSNSSHLLVQITSSWCEVRKMATDFLFWMLKGMDSVSVKPSIISVIFSIMQRMHNFYCFLNICKMNTVQKYCDKIVRREGWSVGSVWWVLGAYRVLSLTKGWPGQRSNGMKCVFGTSPCFLWASLLPLESDYFPKLLRMAYSSCFYPYIQPCLLTPVPRSRGSILQEQEY